MYKESKSERRERYAKEKARDLIGWAYRTLKANAKRRGKMFTITLDEFKEFCFETEILTTRGTKSKSHSIDRIDDRFGYHIGNIQKMELGHNVKKRFNYDWSDKSCSYSEVKQINPDEYPF